MSESSSDCLQSSSHPVQPLSHSLQPSLELASHSGQPSSYFTEPPPYFPPTFDHLPLPSYQDYIVSSSPPNFVPSPTVLPSESSQTTNYSKQCKNCSKFYYENANTPTSCLYHPGQYCGIGWISNFSNFTRWSCCKSGIERQPGCKVGSHVEDLRTSLYLNLFEAKCAAAEARNSSTTTTTITTSTAANSNPIPSPACDQPKTEEDQDPSDQSESESKEEPEQFHFVQYHILPTDTLQGIALRFRLSISQILRDNNLVGYNISHRHSLWIRTKDGQAINHLTEKPKDYQPNKRILEQRFQQMTLASLDEAKCYLEMSDYDFAAAIEAYKSDVDWEREEKPKIN